MYFAPSTAPRGGIGRGIIGKVSAGNKNGRHFAFDRIGAQISAFHTESDAVAHIYAAAVRIVRPVVYDRTSSHTQGDGAALIYVGVQKYAAADGRSIILYPSAVQIESAVPHAHAAAMGGFVAETLPPSIVKAPSHTHTPPPGT